LTQGEIDFALKTGEHWDHHSLAEVWDKTKPADFEVAIEGSYVLIPLSDRLASRVEQCASRNGVSMRRWVSAALQKQLAASAR
jgi:hypothetical protein